MLGQVELNKSQILFPSASIVREYIFWTVETFHKVSVIQPQCFIIFFLGGRTMITAHMLWSTHALSPGLTHLLTPL